MPGLVLEGRVGHPPARAVRHLEHPAGSAGAGSIRPSNSMLAQRQDAARGTGSRTRGGLVEELVDVEADVDVDARRRAVRDRGTRTVTKLPDFVGAPACPARRSARASATAPRSSPRACWPVLRKARSMSESWPIASPARSAPSRRAERDPAVEAAVLAASPGGSRRPSRPSASMTRGVAPLERAAGSAPTCRPRSGCRAVDELDPLVAVAEDDLAGEDLGLLRRRSGRTTRRRASASSAAARRPGLALGGPLAPTLAENDQTRWSSNRTSHGAREAGGEVDAGVVDPGVCVRHACRLCDGRVPPRTGGGTGRRTGGEPVREPGR